MAALPVQVSALAPHHDSSPPVGLATSEFSPQRSSHAPFTCRPRFVNLRQVRKPCTIIVDLRSARSFSRFAASSRGDPVGVGSDFPPTSKEETVQQAGGSLYLLLEKTLKQQGPVTVKQKKSLRQIRLRVDIPLLDDSSEALLTLIRELLDSFLRGTKIAGSVAVHLPNSTLLDARPTDSANSGKGFKTKYLSLDKQEGSPLDEAVIVLVVAPKFSQAAAVDSVARKAGARPVVVLNPEWSDEDETDKTWGSFLTSFCIAYSFVPLNIQGFFSKTEGAVLRNVRKGPPDGQPWRIFVKEGDTYKCVSRLKRRPTPTDLENALYSYGAANSPVSKSINFFRGLVRK